MHDAWAEALTTGIRDHIGDAGVHRRNERVGGAKVNADDLAHAGVERVTLWQNGQSVAALAVRERFIVELLQQR